MPYQVHRRVAIIGWYGVREGPECSTKHGVFEGSALNITIKRLDSLNWAEYSDQIWRIEEASYEPARKDSLETLYSIMRQHSSECFIALNGDKVVGFCFGAGLEAFPYVEGVRTDPEWSKNSTFYSADITVDPEHRRNGVALSLKRSQIERARSKGYRYVAGRNRVGLAAGMMKLSELFGAYEVQFFKGSYRDDLEPTDLSYYHIDLGSQNGR